MNGLVVTWIVKNTFVWKSGQYFFTNIDSLKAIKEDVFAQEQHWARYGKYQVQNKAYTILL